MISIRRIRSLGIRLVLAAGLGSGIVGLTAAPVGAYTYYSSGYPGAVQTPRIVGTKVDSMTGNMTFAPRTIWKSPRYAAYNQYVCVTYEAVYAVVPATSWQQWGFVRLCTWISGTATAHTFPGVRFMVNADPFINSGNFTVTWQLSNGVQIGKRIFDYNGVGDYSCNCVIAATRSLGAYLLF